MKVLEIIDQEGIAINFEKSIFYQREVNYLEHIISNVGIRADLGRVKALNFPMPPPRTAKELRMILEFINWFRPYVVNLSSEIAF